jgi:5-amino-6-(5-phosphoribosylamino)uracil reductase
MSAETRPRIIANLAISVDGKIDSALFEGGRFSSRRDRERLDALRARADALVIGAGTMRHENPPLFIRNAEARAARVAEGRHEHLIVVVISRSGQIPVDARFLSEPARERWIVTPEGVTLEPTLLQAAQHRELGPEQVDLERLATQLARAGVETLLVEGGGTTLAAFNAVDLLDELYLTLCPVLIGGKDAPTLCDGPPRALADLRRWQLDSLERFDHELFLRYLRR